MQREEASSSFGVFAFGGCYDVHFSVGIDGLGLGSHSSGIGLGEHFSGLGGFGGVDGIGGIGGIYGGTYVGVGGRFLGVGYILVVEVGRKIDGWWWQMAKMSKCTLALQQSDVFPLLMGAETGSTLFRHAP